MGYASRITGIGSHFPQRALTNEELARDLAAKGLETNDAWIVERTGIRERRIAEPGNPREVNSSLALVAARKALEMAGKTAEDVDQIIFATCSPDALMPSAACYLQHKLGAKRAYAFDINAACSGFVYALSIADSFIKAGTVKTSLVLGSEVLSPITNWDDRTSCILFGDGSGAAVVERTEESNPRRILSHHMRSEGDLW
ncbi:MAG TPA: 3-oxoacyl-ACP synthase, partial [Bdellovibrionota bacterium]|nr:3-oxoacyl-ACP synthase [Bdellovibrionota bacterium]